jgi:hypothetical protein
MAGPALADEVEKSMFSMAYGVFATHRGYKSPEGKWVFVWDFNTALQRRSSDVSNLGILYAFSGDEKYAKFAKKILLALADAFGHGQEQPAHANHHTFQIPKLGHRKFAI